MSDLKICFMGTPDFARTVLESLVNEGYKVVLCCCQPDKPVGRKKIITAPPVKVFAQEKGIDVFQPDSMRTDEAYETISKYEPDLIITAAYGKILPSKVLNIPTMGCVNVHASLLPKYRGAAPVQYAIMNGDKVTGVTIMEMDEGMDTGAMIDKVEVAIRDDVDTETLMSELAVAGSKLLIDTLPKYLNGEILAHAQNNDEATVCGQIKPDQGVIDWTWSAQKIHDLVRALTNWPGASTILDGNKLKIYKTHVAEFEDADLKPGQIAKAHKKDLFVKCGEGYLAIDELQTAGGKRLQAIDCAHNFKVGTMLGEGV